MEEKAGKEKAASGVKEVGTLSRGSRESCGLRGSEATEPPVYGNPKAANGETMSRRDREQAGSRSGEGDKAARDGWDEEHKAAGARGEGRSAG